MPHFELPTRSIAKTITYRLIILIFNTLVVFWFTKDSSTTFDISLVLGISSTIIYFLHERMWNRLHWGKRSKK